MPENSTFDMSAFGGSLRRHVSATRWGTRQYLNMDRLTENIAEMAWTPNAPGALVARWAFGLPTTGLLDC